MNEDDLKTALIIYDSAHEATDAICTSQSLEDITVHKGKINDAISSVESVVTHFDRFVKHYQGLRDEWKDRKRVLERDFDKAKDSYWLVKNEKDRIIPNQ